MVPAPAPFLGIPSCMTGRAHFKAKAEYTGLKTDEERRSWLANYVLDPSSSSNQGFNRTEAFIGKQNDNKEQWLTQAQLESPAWLASVDHVKVLLDQNQLEERPHEMPALAAAGVKQYKFIWSLFKRSDGLRETVS